MAQEKRVEVTEHEPPVGIAPVSVQFQSTLYQTPVGSLLRSVESLSRAAELASSGPQPLISRATLALGDASAEPVLDAADLARVHDLAGEHMSVSYTFHGANVGSARGHNLLGLSSDADFLFLANPDVVVIPRLLSLLLEPMKRPGVGITEARQIPLDHPKAYDPLTGQTSWASGACTFVKARLFRVLDGYDADTFFMYGDDVDLSWRVRERGLSIIHQPAAVVFHDRRPNVDGSHTPTAAERYYSAEAALLLAYKWSRPDVVARVSQLFEESHDAVEGKALAAFRRRTEEGRLPAPRDPEHVVGDFVDLHYGAHRY
ncbi:MAG: hypothetical protein V9F04_11405 [Dermatophilaceae bacterium]